MIRFIGNKILVIPYNLIGLMIPIDELTKESNIKYRMDISSPANCYISLDYDDILQYNYFLHLINKRIKDIVKLETILKKDFVQC